MGSLKNKRQRTKVIKDQKALTSKGQSNQMPINTAVQLDISLEVIPEKGKICYGGSSITYQLHIIRLIHAALIRSTHAYQCTHKSTQIDLQSVRLSLSVHRSITDY